MNKHSYKVIFNKTRNQMMAVAETASSHSKDSSSDSTPANPASRRLKGSIFNILAFSLLCSFGLASVQASAIYADPNAPRNQRPVILQTANGLPQINIQTPSKGGVSVNQYKQFDVSKPGVILNNSRKNARTQLAGMVQGNPYLSGGEARIIVNQINSSNPSYLNGHIEVAGKRAEVIIANPSGININGGGFINAAGVTLTTGQLGLNNGRLQNISVSDGNIRIDGDGLDSSQSDYTRILARTAQINGSIWGNDLSIIAGHNQISDNGQISASAQSDNNSTSPRIAIDSSALGGMYAGKITLISTEKGLGVNTGGHIYGGAGGIHLDINGKLTNSGELIASDRQQQGHNIATLNIQAQDISNSGTISSQGQSRLHSNQLSNSSLITSADELHISNSYQLSNSGEINAGRLDISSGSLNNSGKLIQTGSQTLALHADQLDNRNQGSIGYPPANSGNSQPDSTDKPVTSPDQPATTPPAGTPDSGNSNTASQPAPSQPAIAAFADGNIQVSNEFINDGGQIIANGGIDLSVKNGLTNHSSLNLHQLHVQGAQLDNSQGSISASQIDIHTDHINNRQGKLQAGQSMQLHSHSIDNSSAGQLISAGQSSITTGQLSNHSGAIDADSLSLTAHTIDNSSGTIRTNRELQLTASDHLNNQHGTLSAVKDLHIQSNSGTTRTSAGLSIDNSSDGQILAGQDLTLQAQTLDNHGTISAGRDASLSLTNDFNIEADLTAGHDLSISSQGSIHNNNTLTAGHNLSLTATSIDNSGSGIIQSNNDTRLHSSDSTINRGLINSNGTTHIQAGNTLTNLGTGRIYGDHIALQANTLINREESRNGSTKAATIAARQRLDIGASHIINQEDSLISSAGDIAIGGSLDQNRHASGMADSLINASARIEAQGNGNIAAHQLQNLNNHFTVEEYLDSKEHIQQYQEEGNPEIWVNGQDGKFKQERKKLSFTFNDGSKKTWEKYSASKVHWWDFDRKTYKQRITESKPGQIIIGGDLNISGEHWLNDNSQIIVGGNLLGSSKLNLENKETKAQQRIEDNGKQGGYKYKNSSLKKGKIKTTGEKKYQQTITTTGEFDSPVSIIQQHAQTSPGQHQTDAAQISTATSTISGNAQISTIDSHIKLPNSSLYAIKPDNTGYLIETDPAFTNQKKWLGSDYMLSALGQDPQRMQKRLGDGYYEQQLINDQIIQLTGNRYLTGHNDNTEQYKALMNAGIEYAQSFNLSPGIALSAEQMAQLTSSIVWLVSQTVTLADGSQQNVLVPKVYLAASDTQLGQNGALISAGNISLQQAGNIDNQGTIKASNTLILNAENISNSGTISANKIGLSATDSIHFNGGNAIAGEALSLKADKISLNTTTTSYGDQHNGGSIIDRTAGLYVTGDQNGKNGLLSIDGQHGIETHGAELINLSSAGTTQLISQKGDISLGTVSQSQNMASGSKQDKNHWINRYQSESGTSISTSGDLSLLAGNELNIRQSDLNSDNGSVNLYGQNGVNISTGRQQTELDHSVYIKTSKITSKKTELSQHQAQHNEAVASNITGAQVHITSDKDINIQGSNIISDNSTSLSAGHDINITAADNRYRDHEYHKTTKSGLMGAGGGIGFSIGSEKDTTDTTSQSHLHSGSMVGSLNGDTTIIAGHHYNQSGSSISSPKGNIGIQAQQINISAATDSQQSDTIHTYEKKGITVAVNIPVVAAVQKAAEATKKIGQSKNKRVNAMAAFNAGYSSYEAGKATGLITGPGAPEGSQSGGTDVSVSITYGQQKNRDENHSHETSASASSINAGGTVSLIATGAGKDSNINITGSDISGNQGTQLWADNQINLLAAEQHHSEHSENKSSGFNAGVAISYGSSGMALGFTAGGNYGKGHSNGQDTTHRHSHIGSSTGQTSLHSGGTTSISGARVTGSGIKLEAAELNITSLQDTSTYDSKQKNGSAQITVGYGASGSVNYSQSKLNADYAAVTEQSGLFAGDNGYQINVGGHTQLNGALITSTAKAEAAGKNRLTTGTLGYSDIKNHSDYKGESFGIGLSGSVSGGNGPTQLGGQQLMNQGPTGAGGSVGHGSDQDHQSSTTHSGINTGNITLTDKEHQSQNINNVHTDVTTENHAEHAGYLANSFDKDKVQHELDTQREVTQAFSDNSQKLKAEMGRYTDQLKEKQKNETDPDKRAALQKEIDNWALAGLLVNSISAGLSAPTDSIGGIIAATASPAIAYEIGQYFKENGTEGSAAHLLAHAALGAAVAAAGGNNALTGAISAAGGEAVAPVLSHWLYGKDPQELNADEKQTISSIAGLAGAAVGAATGNSADIAGGFQAAQNALYNNEFTAAKAKEFLKEIGVYGEVTAAAGLGMNVSITLNPDGSATITVAPAIGLGVEAGGGISGGDSRPDGGYIEFCAGGGVYGFGASGCYTSSFSDFNLHNPKFQRYVKAGGKFGLHANANVGYQFTILKPKEQNPYQNYYKPWNSYAPADWRF